MRLLRTDFASSGALEACEFYDLNCPPYAILSHTWGDDEVLFADLKAPDVTTRAGFRKVQLTLEQARKDGWKWAWIDTACINKDSSAELSEAINAMYAWYQQAQVCYVYLSDLEWNWYMFASEFQKTRWFTRGWTLQELLAPQKLRFFDRHWQPVGDKTTLAPYIEAAARIPSGALDGSRSIHSFSIAQRMSWAASRSTTRVEDLAYCLMGLFRVNMPMLYGEGAKSFLRLQEEIMKESDDQSLFAWRAECEGDRHGLLADSPRAFKDSGDIVSLRGISNERDGHLSHAMTNRGLHIELATDTVASERGIDAQLECKGSSEHHSLAIRLFPTPESSRHYVRGQCAQLISHKDPFTAWLPLYVRQTNAMTTAPSEVPFHQIAVTACHTSVELQELPWRGFYTDVFGRKEQWDSTTSQMRLQTVKLFKRSSLPSGYLVLYDGDLALLIGSDASGQLAFDVWEPKEGNIQWDGSTFRLLVNDHQGRHSALPRMHNFLQRAFEPSSPGTVMRKLERYNVQVLAEKFYEGRLPVHDLKITRTKKVDEPQSPAARSIPARPKEGRRGLFGHRHRRAQEPSPS